MTLTTTFLTILVALISAIFGPIIVEIFKNKLRKRTSTVDEAIKVDEKIDQQLEYILEELKCDRVYISQFHNGGHFYPTGKSIKKFSIFYELLTDKAPSVKQTFQNIPVSLFPKVFSILYRDSEIVIPDCQNNEVDCGIFPPRNKKYKTKSHYILAIYDLNGDFIGTLSLSYYTQSHKLSLEEWIMLRQKVGAIGTILTNYLHDRK